MTDLPARMTTSEVCALARISRNTFARRRKPGQPYARLTPCDRGAELLFNKTEVLEALGMLGREAVAPLKGPDWPTDIAQIRASLARPKKEWFVDPEAIKAARLMVSRKGSPPARNKPATGPTAQAEIREVTGFLGKYVKVMARPGGLYHAYFQAPTKGRPPGWASSIPISGAGAFRLNDTGRLTEIRYRAAELLADLGRDRADQRGAGSPRSC